MKKTEIQLHRFPEKWLPRQWVKYFDFYLLGTNDRCDVLEELIELSRKSQQDFKKLLSTLKLQVESDELLKLEKRLQKGRLNREILEYKGGKCRLFGFLNENHRSIIICTNTYWKTTGKKEKQSSAFKKAERLMEQYKSEVKKYE